MSNPSKARGTGFEVAVRDYFRTHGFSDTERLPTEGSKDRGDLKIPRVPYAVELKAEKAINLSGYMNEAKAEALNAGHPFHAAIVKRRNHSVADAYAVLPLSIFVEMLGAIYGQDA